MATHKQFKGKVGIIVRKKQFAGLIRQTKFSNHLYKRYR